MNIEEIISTAKSLRDKIQSGIDAGEHVIETAKGKVPTGQLVNAAGHAAQLVKMLENHVAAAKEIIASAGAPAAKAAPAATPKA